MILFIIIYLKYKNKKEYKIKSINEYEQPFLSSANEWNGEYKNGHISFWFYLISFEIFTPNGGVNLINNKKK